MIAFITIFLFMFAQPTDTLTLQQVRQLASKEAAFTHDRSLNKQILDAQEAYWTKQWYPEFSLNGQASYQTDVPRIPVSIPGQSIPSAPNDRYEMSLDVNQSLWDGGRSEYEQQIAGAQADVTATEISQSARERDKMVRGIYFDLLGEQNRLAMIDQSLKVLQNKLDEVTIRVREGATLKMQQNQIAVEIEQLRQQKTQITTQSRSQYEQLSLLTGRTISHKIKLKLPKPVIPSTDLTNNLLLEKLSHQKELLQTQKEALSVRNQPNVQLFGKAAYGKPGQELFTDEFGAYALGGVRLKWKVWDWNQTEKQQKILEYRGDLIGQQKQRLEQNLNSNLILLIGRYESMKETLARDDRILKLRRSILADVEKQWKQGVLTASDFIEEHARLRKAELEKELHRIQLSEITQEIVWITGI